MFTGIIEAIGKVREVEAKENVRRIFLSPPPGFGRFRTGESVAVSGVCLTSLLNGAVFCAAISAETLSRSCLGSLRPGHCVNLERAVRASSRLSGHLVQGHVDAVGRVTAIQKLGAGRLFTFSFPRRLARYIVEKGSVAIDGISLTAFHCRNDRFDVAVIPHTLDSTTLSSRKPGDRVNLEVDVLAKYVERLLSFSC